MKSDRSEKRNYVAVLSLVRTIRATKLKVKTTATKLTNMGVGRGQNPPGFWKQIILNKTIRQT